MTSSVFRGHAWWMRLQKTADMYSASKPSLLIASPWPPEPSEIARHVAEVQLPALQQHAELQLVCAEAHTNDVHGITVHGQALKVAASVVAASSNALLIAHIGNETRQNDAALEALALRPGVVVMHDIVLHHAWYDACMRADHFEDYLASVRKYGGAELAQQALPARHHSAVVHRLARSLPLFEPFLHNALGVVVHSQMAFDAVNAHGLWPVRQLGLPAPMPKETVPLLAHRRRQVAELKSGATLRVLVFGYLGPNRCLNQIIDAMAILVSQSKAVRLDIYGRVAEVDALQQNIERAKLASHVAVHGFVSESELESAMRAAHLACNLRAPSMGEASASQLRLYAAALPALVVRTGWYSEQPEDAVLHLDPARITGDLVASIMRLLDAPEQLLAMATKGLSHLLLSHDPATYAQQLVAFANECVESGSAYMAARRYVASAAGATAALAGLPSDRAAKSIADLCGLPGDAPGIGRALRKSCQIAAEPMPQSGQGRWPGFSTTMPIDQMPYVETGSDRLPRHAISPDPSLTELARRAHPRSALPTSLQGGLLGKLGLSAWLLKLWNYASRDWREPAELTHRLLARLDPAVAELQHRAQQHAIDMQKAQARIAQAQQQTLMLRADLIAAEEKMAEFMARMQQLHPGAPMPLAGPPPMQAAEHDFLESVASHFRGDPGALKARLSIHIPAVEEAIANSSTGTRGEQHGPDATLLDLGCGRGEWLELVRDAGYSAMGLDLSPECVLACQERGLNVQLADALSVLKQMPDSSLLVVTAFHLVEHLPLGAQIALFKESHRVLKAGGLLLVETPNPENLVVISRNFWFDPTHQRPVPAQMLVLLATMAGYTNTETQFLQPPAVPALEVEHYAPRLRHMLFCGEDTVLRAVK